jgi:transposase
MAEAGTRGRCRGSIPPAGTRPHAPIERQAARTARVHLEQFPAYAPELNPDEGIWHYLKQVELRNRCCDDLAELRRELRLAAARLRQKLTALQGCIGECGYAVP